MSRRLAWLALLALVATACGSIDPGDGGDIGGDGTGSTDGTRSADGAGTAGSAEPVAATCETDGPVEVDQVEPDPEEDVPSALDDRFDEAFPEPLVDPNEIRSGGPPPDGIPPIDEPTFVRQCSVDWLTASDPVLSLEIDGDARAYPLRVMTWHELANDTIGGVPVTVSYCPLCNSALAYDRRAGDRVLDFGTSGSLFNSALVMYDRQTESLWSHFTARAVVGVLTGTELDTFPMQTVAFEDFRSEHPDGLVLSRDTGFDRDYGRNPYSGYDDPDSSPFLFEGDIDPALPAKTRVVTLERGGGAVAIVQERLLEERVLEFEMGGETLVAVAKPGTASALDDSEVAQGRDVGATGVFVPEVDGQHLSFGAAGEQFVDEPTGSTWNILGHAVSGPLEGSELTAVEHLNTFWFAWSAFQPDTEILLRDDGSA